MIKAKPSMIPWDCVQVVDVPLENFITMAQRWWCHEVARPTCAIPFDYVLPIGRVLAYGCVKYPLKEGRAWETERAYHRASYHFDALIRHAFTPGMCEESGLMHEWHAATRYMMLAALHARGLLIDDRPAPQLAETEVRVPEGSYRTGGGNA